MPRASPRQNNEAVCPESSKRVSDGNKSMVATSMWRWAAHSLSGVKWPLSFSSSPAYFLEFQGAVHRDPPYPFILQCDVVTTNQLIHENRTSLTYIWLKIENLITE